MSAPAVDAWGRMVMQLAGEPLWRLNPSLPINGLRHVLFTSQAAAGAGEAVIWRLVAGRAVKVRTSAPKASNGAE